MKIKQTILIFALLIGVCALFASPNVSAADCGGVNTSIISCNEKGQCPGGENAFDGNNPVNPSRTPDENAKSVSDYEAKYKHSYGLCVGGVAPNTNVEENGIWSLLLLAINILTGGIIFAAIGGVIYGSIMYTTAGGSPDQVKKARVIIGNVIIGLVAYALMYSFMNFIIPGGLFS